MTTRDSKLLAPIATALDYQHTFVVVAQVGDDLGDGDWHYYSALATCGFHASVVPVCGSLEIGEIVIIAREDA